jgi:hypothetical protein
MCGGGACAGTLPVVCNDANTCTTDSCSPATGCVFTNNTNACDDGNACTTGDACGGGTCVGGPALNCADDGDLCTANVCDPASGCVAADANWDAGGFSADRVDGRDLVVLADAWNTCSGQPKYNAAANLDCDATPPGPCVDMTDFHLFMNAFGHSCP